MEITGKPVEMLSIAGRAFVPALGFYALAIVQKTGGHKKQKLGVRLSPPIFRPPK